MIAAVEKISEIKSGSGLGRRLHLLDIRILPSATLTAEMQPWIRVGVEVFTRCFLLSPFSLLPYGKSLGTKLGRDYNATPSFKPHYALCHASYDSVSYVPCFLHQTLIGATDLLRKIRERRFQKRKQQTLNNNTCIPTVQRCKYHIADTFAWCKISHGDSRCKTLKLNYDFLFVRKF